MHVTARVDYALQTMLALAEVDPEPRTAAAIAEELGLSYHYLLSAIGELRRAGFVRMKRGVNGGLLLARPASDITLGEIVWAVDGPLTLPSGPQLDLHGSHEPAGCLDSLWVAAHQAMLGVFSQVRLADARTKRLPNRSMPALSPSAPPVL